MPSRRKILGVTPFTKFIDSLSALKSEQYLDVPDTRVRDESEFEIMRRFLLNYYDGIEPKHSFIDANGSIFDCIRFDRQPALKEAVRVCGSRSAYDNLTKTPF